ncbi:MRP10 [[Candida] subhashii]|uniref:MRP10 n=1 Tax=[Candida] subhashii TaxID=561895 RepID=A0A8J5QIA8_9ASCO|nr:MRP10 [[Candida] subhashii]KAG7663537.1 MRP10 [[Candida] subhashii]
MAYKKVGPPPRGLPPLPRFRPKKTLNASTGGANNECMIVMSSLLNCWASNGESASICERFATELKQCMAVQKKGNKGGSGSSNDSERLYPKLRGKVHD